MFVFSTISRSLPSFLVSIYSLAGQTHFRTKRKGSGSDLSPSVVFSLPFRIMYLYLPLYPHLRLTGSHSRPRKTANWPTNALRACLLGGSKYFKGGPNTTVKFGLGVQLLRGSKYYVTGHIIDSTCHSAIYGHMNRSLVHYS